MPIAQATYEKSFMNFHIRMVKTETFQTKNKKRVFSKRFNHITIEI